MGALEKFSLSKWIKISASCTIFRFKSNDSSMAMSWIWLFRPTMMNECCDTKSETLTCDCTFHETTPPSPKSFYLTWQAFHSLSVLQIMFMAHGMCHYKKCFGFLRFAGDFRILMENLETNGK